MASVRSRGLTKQKTLTSPIDPDAHFVIKKATNRDDVERSNLFSKVRLIQNLGSPDEIIQERDNPAGEIQVATILLCLVSWDLTDEKGRVLDTTIDNILDCLDPAERVFLYREIMKFNPIWRGKETNEDDPEPEVEAAPFGAPVVEEPGDSAGKLD